MTPGRPDDLISVSAAAGRLGVNASTIYRWIRAGILPSTRIGPHIVRVRVRDVDALQSESGESTENG